MILFLKTRLRAAIESGDLIKLEQLLEGTKNLEVLLESGSGPLQYAVMKKREDVVDFLIKKGANVNAQNGYGWTPLHRAAFLGQLGSAARLLKAGADPNIRDDNGKNVHGMAQVRGETEVAELVLPYIKKEVFDLPPVPAPVPAVKEETPSAPLMGSGWQLLGEQQVSRTLSNSAVGYRLTDVFDFRARERIRIVNNTETKRDTLETTSFDAVPDKSVLEDALTMLTRLGGKADATSIHGGLQKPAKLAAPSP